MEPVKIQASASGPHEPSCVKIHAHTSVEIMANATMPTRSRFDAQCGCTAFTSSAGSDTIDRDGSVSCDSRRPALRACDQFHQP